MKFDEIPDGSLFIEFRAIYDGWSAVQLPSGELLNRWDPTAEPVRWSQTEKAIERIKTGSNQL